MEVTMDNDYDTKLARKAFTIYEAMAKLAKEIRRATPLFVIYESLAKSVYGDMSQVTDEVIMQELGFTETDILRYRRNECFALQLSLLRRIFTQR
jgi:predicted transcriptional regulator